MCFWTGASDSISGGKSKFVPVFFGTNTALFIPNPHDQVPKRIGIGTPDASAVPFSFKKQLRRGSETLTTLPFSMPFKTRRLLHFLMPLSPVSSLQS
jgi:hypothetical protein